MEATYHICAIGSPLCPVCNHPRESLQCDLCGHTEAEQPAVEIVQPEPKPNYDPPGYHRCVLESPVCKECSTDLQIIEGELRCPMCGGNEERKPIQIVDGTTPEDPSLITPDFLRCLHGDNPAKNEPCQRELLTDYVAQTTRFVCPVCGDAKPVPVAPSRAVAAASAIPVIGPIAGPVVQAAENMVRRQKRR